MYRYDQAEEMLISFLKKFQEGTNITDDLDLFESRVITSLRFLEFVILLEEVSGEEIDPNDVDFSRLRTLAAIKSHYLAGLEGA